MKKKRMFVILFLAIFYTACSENKISHSADNNERIDQESSIPIPSSTSISYNKGDVVPNDEVCMVNDAFMGRKQIEVKYNGKLYYGCCEMCEKRIQEEGSVRMAVDPVSKKQVDKASAVIVITGDNGKVSYFETVDSYKAFLQQ